VCQNIVKQRIQSIVGLGPTSKLLLVKKLHVHFSSDLAFSSDNNVRCIGNHAESLPSLCHVIETYNTGSLSTTFVKNEWLMNIAIRTAFSGTMGWSTVCLRACNCKEYCHRLGTCNSRNASGLSFKNCKYNMISKNS